MGPILSFLSMFKEYIIGVTIFAEHCNDNMKTTIEEVRDIKIQDDYVYFIGTEDVLGIPIDGAIVDFDYENGETNLITVFNKKFGYIKTKKLPIFE